MLDVNLSSQVYSFLCSLLCGFLLGAIYTIFKCLRTAFGNGRISTVILDLMFMFVFTLITFLFSTGFSNGFVRYYVLLGEFSGILIFKFTVGRVVHFAFSFILVILRKVTVFLQKNVAQFAKKLLKARDNMLYNIENKSNIRRSSEKGERKNGA